MIKEHRLNRLVVASCSPRTHEVLFQETLRDSGLNQYLFAMANIRDQGSWVHKDDPVAATEKAVDLMAMAVARARHLKALQTGQLPVTAVRAHPRRRPGRHDRGAGHRRPGLPGPPGGEGGGAGRPAARRPQHPRRAPTSRRYLRDLVEQGAGPPLIDVYLNATPAEHHRPHRQLQERHPHVGRARRVTVSHGVVIVATGGQERATELYLHGKNPHVTTQSKLEAALAEGELSARACRARTTRPWS